MIYTYVTAEKLEWLFLNENIPVRLAMAATRWYASDLSSTAAELVETSGDHDCLCLVL